MIVPNNLTCPDCGSEMELVTDGLVFDLVFTTTGDVEHKPRLAPFGACSGCEFCVEIQPADLSAAKEVA